MSFSYSGDPSISALDLCRFMLGDTDIDDVILQDEEIEYVISIHASEANSNYLYHELFTRAATMLSRNIKHSLGPQSEDPTERINYYRSKAKEYEDKIDKGSGLSIPCYASPKVFGKGMMNNPPWRPPLGR